MHDPFNIARAGYDTPCTLQYFHSLFTSPRANNKAYRHSVDPCIKHNTSRGGQSGKVSSSVVAADGLTVRVPICRWAMDLCIPSSSCSGQSIHLGLPISDSVRPGLGLGIRCHHLVRGPLLLLQHLPGLGASAGPALTPHALQLDTPL